MSIEYDQFKGDAEGEAKAAFLRATTGPKAAAGKTYNEQ